MPNYQELVAAMKSAIQMDKRDWCNIRQFHPLVINIWGIF
jgi:hypothetical protein